MIPVTPRTTQHLIEWCRTYQESGTVPQPKHIRFSIGIYQITQGMLWEIASPVRWQSFCAAAMHFIMCAEAYGESLGDWLPDTLEEINETSGPDIWRDLLMAIGRTQQQIVYHTDISGQSNRKTRYNPHVFRSRMLTLVESCFALTPKNYREQGCFDEMRILTGDITIK